MVLPQKKITIGLPIYNEEQRLPEFLNSLQGNVVYLQRKGYEVEIIARLNGTVDKSQATLIKKTQTQLFPRAQRCNTSLPEREGNVTEAGTYAFV